ncbi:MAG: hypothetical protein JJU36_01985 [Phycisphaeraceae bacterium]|nr:hypothetical protein [Phycisphaeraceae bacterium]
MRCSTTMIMMAVAAIIMALSGQANAGDRPGAQVPDFEMELRLSRALGTGTDVENPSGATLLIDLQRGNGHWGRAWGLNAHTGSMANRFMGRVAEADIQANRVNLTVELLPRTPGGRILGAFDVGDGVIRATMELRQHEPGLLPGSFNWEGTYEVTRAGNTVTGRVDGRVAPARPQPPEGFQPLKPGERPRILVRDSDLDDLRAKAETPLGQALLTAIGERGHDAVGAALRYRITGDRKYADRAREFTKRQMQGHEGLYSHRSGSGRPPQHVAMAYDLCHDAWDADFKKEVVDHLVKTAADTRSGAFFVGGNHHVCSNWVSHIYSALGFIGMALSAEKGERPAAPEGDDADLLRPFWEQEVAIWERNGGLDPHYQLILDEGRFMMFWFNREGAGIGGFHGELAHYGSHAMVAPLEFAVCYRKMFGMDVSPWDDITMVVPRRMFGHHFPASGSPQMLGINGRSNLTGHWAIIETGFALAPEEWQPQVLWAWNRLYGLDEPERPAREVLAERARRLERRSPSSALGIGAATWFLMNYPLDMEPKHPGISDFPLTWKAPSFGYYAFRSGWGGDDDFILQVFSKQHMAGGWHGHNGGTFHLFGLGRSWNHTNDDRRVHAWGENRVMLPDDDTGGGHNTGRVTHYGFKENGSGSVSIDMSDLYTPRGAIRYSRYANTRYIEQPDQVNVKALRAMGVDYGGGQEAPVVFVLVDRIEWGGEKVWNWNLTHANLIDRVTIEGNTFTLPTDHGTLRGTFVTPADVKITVGQNQGGFPAIQARGGDAFFMVATITAPEADVPRVNIRGRGLDAQVNVAGRSVRFDGRKVNITDTNRR